MKKWFTIFTICFAIGNASAQGTLSAQNPEWAQKISILSPAAAKATLLEELNAFGPPTNELNFNLLDSTYYQEWNPFSAHWGFINKTSYVNDCDLGKPTLELVEDQNDLSGVVEAPLTRREYSYFSDGSLKQQNSYLWSEDLNAWQHYSHTEYFSPNNLQEDWNRSWNGVLDEFDGGSRRVVSYDAEGKSILSEDYDFESQNTWLLKSRYTFTYNNADLLAEWIVEHYNNGNWVYDSRVIYTYTASGKISTKKTDYYVGPNWKSNQITTYNYDFNDNLLEFLTQFYTANGLINSSKGEYSYYPNGNYETGNLYNWNNAQQLWIPYLKDSLNMDNKPVFFSYKYYDESAGVFLFGIREFNTYNQEGLKVFQVREELVFNTFDEWKNLQHVTYGYDANGRITLLTNEDWDENSLAYVNNFQYEYFNTGCLFNQTSEPTGAIANCLNANPLQAGMTIACDALPTTDEPLKLSLFAMSGVNVHQQVFRSGESFQPSRHIAHGLYVLDIRNANGLQVHRAKVWVIE